MKEVYVFFKNGKPIIERLPAGPLLGYDRLAWCKVRDKEKHLGWWRDEYPRSKIRAVLVSMPKEKS